METWNDIRHADILAPTEDSASVPMNDFSDVPSLSTNDEVVDMGTDFDFEGFQVVRREFFAHLHEPSVTFNNYKFYVNCACLNKFPEASFVQVLVNQETKIMALRPCVENARDSFAWCGISKKKRSPRQITCKLFFAKMFSLMDWNPDYRYKLLGRLIHANGKYMLSRVLRLCAGTWEGDENSFSANILNGITRLVYTFGNQLNDEVFKERVGALSIKQLVRMSKERCPGSMGYAEAMLLEYNGKKKNISQRLSMNKLHMQGTAGLCSLLSDVDTSSEAATAEGVSE